MSFRASIVALLFIAAHSALGAQRNADFLSVTGQKQAGASFLETSSIDGGEAVEDAQGTSDQEMDQSDDISEWMQKDTSKDAFLETSSVDGGEAVEDAQGEAVEDAQGTSDQEMDQSDDISEWMEKDTSKDASFLETSSIDGGEAVEDAQGTSDQEMDQTDDVSEWMQKDSDEAEDTTPEESNQGSGMEASKIELSSGNANSDAASQDQLRFEGGEEAQESESDDESESALSDKMLKHFDTDKDNSISLKELVAGSSSDSSFAKQFTQADADKNGVLSLKEVPGLLKAIHETARE